ncbi:MAG: M56 family metallopeptidase [Patescibacteria group bacterium]
MKINKNITIYTSGIIVAVALLLLSINNLFPLAVQHTLYYCQSALKFPSQVLLSILSVIILLPISKMVFIFYQTITFKRKLKFSTEIIKDVSFLAMKHNLKDRIKVFETTKPYAFCLGIKRPNIYLSTGLTQIMNKHELEAIILHEKYHIESNDNISLLILSLAKQFLIMFPIFSDILNNFMLKKELEADQAVISHLKSKKELISAFVKLFKTETASLPIASFFTEPSTIERRVKVLVNKSSRLESFRLRNVWISFVSVMILLTVLLLPLQKTEVHAKNTDEVMICLRRESCDKICRESHPMSHM